MILPDWMTIGETYGPAMDIGRFAAPSDEAEALEYFEALVARHLRCTPKSREEAEQIERSNLAYFAGYYDSDTRARVERLFNCAHPVFGAIAEKGPPSPEEAFGLGYELASCLARLKP